ncbi:hypothetical protein [Bradyrhizobium yuanmingense]|uniref:hypothetical protein n=1 Tax=Bradyrhizobium yuanmingense TaxID=108015 RepID=UPI0023B9E681|nr:hypothetical protein [Bradyrhizobium yuanmingense]MDF0582216.1 hypothetical protein [Bradyrhizobium yuanmingense]
MLATIYRGSSVKPPLVDRIQLWLSTSRMVDGIWIGTLSDDPERALQRVEAALRLIERSAPLHYQRVKKSLSRIWVQLVPHGAGCYQHSLNACLLDPRVVASETTTIEWIASAIVHEATHARLKNWGIRYDEAARPRIERICARRELDFARHLTGVDALQEEIAQRLDLCRDEGTYYTDQNMQQNMDEGVVEALRHLRTPEWAISLLFRVRDLRVGVRRFTRRIAGVLVR